MNPATEQFALCSECVLCAYLRGNLNEIHAAEWGHTVQAAAKKGGFIECFFYLCPEHGSCQEIEVFSVG
jgi:hypothetical protein